MPRIYKKPSKKPAIRKDGQLSRRGYTKLNTDDYACFVAAVEAGSGAAAVQAMGFEDKTSVNVAINRLQRALCVDLFDGRVKARLLTDAGKIAYEHAKEIVKREKKMLRELKELREDNPYRQKAAVGGAKWIQRDYGERIGLLIGKVRNPIYVRRWDEVVDSLAAEYITSDRKVFIGLEPLDIPNTESKQIYGERYVAVCHPLLRDDLGDIVPMAMFAHPAIQRLVEESVAASGETVRYKVALDDPWQCEAVVDSAQLVAFMPEAIAETKRFTVLDFFPSFELPLYATYGV